MNNTSEEVKIYLRSEFQQKNLLHNLVKNIYYFQILDYVIVML